MTFWKFEVFEKWPGLIFQIPAKKMGFENAHPMVLQIPAKKWGLENRATPKIQIRINGKMDLEKLI